MHTAALTYVAQHLPSGALRVLEFGSRNVNGSVREIINDPIRYVGVDIAPGDGVDVVADAATVNVPGVFDVVVCCEVFEHADDSTCAKMIASAYRHLVAGGKLIATMAGPGRPEHSALDGGRLRPDEFYRNVDVTLLSTWLEAAGFSSYDTDQTSDDVRCVAVKAG